LVVCIAIGTMLSALLSRWFLKPVNQLIRATRSVAAGDFSVRVDEAGAKSELIELIRSFNTMAEELGSLELFRRDFIDTFSHEFKTPIVSIRGFARQLRNPRLSDAQRREYVDIIVAEADRLTNMSSNILMLTRFEHQQIVTECEDIRIDEQLRACILLLEKEWMKKGIVFDLALEDATYRGNQEMLSQLFINLIGNAVKFSHDKGEIRVACHRDKKHLVVEVEDHGVGMDEETKKRIFEQFFQGATSRATEGNGLGLTIVQRIVELMRGGISVRSEPGTGSLFTVRLPL
ncbi:MAG TPA: HAMP domain-containing sensor histidine kinase, partial [Clostridia bacterium]|nr:HAMP domain-containing sensor histidine kinase [Clostridia bacterium]